MLASGAASAHLAKVAGLPRCSSGAGVVAGEPEVVDRGALDIRGGVCDHAATGPPDDDRVPFWRGSKQILSRRGDRLVQRGRRRPPEGLEGQCQALSGAQGEEPVAGGAKVAITLK